MPEITFTEDELRGLDWVIDVARRWVEPAAVARKEPLAANHIRRAAGDGHDKIRAALPGPIPLIDVADPTHPERGTDG